jgi:Domain of unknown function (DUF4352)
MSTSPGAGGAIPPVPPLPDSARSASRNRLAQTWSDPSRRPILVIGFAAVMIAIILLMVAITQLSPSESAAVTPTPTVTSPQSVTLVPTVLHLRSRSFFINPVNVSKGRWNYNTDSGKAEWVFGTLINYLVGLPASQENTDMLQALSDADEITLDLSNGQTLHFKYSGRQFVSPGSVDIFSQSRPGLTLVLLGATSEQRLVVTANYAVESEVGKPGPGTLGQINTPIELGGVKVTVLSARFLYNAPGIPVGSAFYMVDYTVENTGADPIDAGKFQIELQDYSTQKYKVSLTASQLGPNAVAKGQILPGIAATFTSGFEVPSNVTGPVLTWIFSPQPGFKAQASVAVPLVGPTPTPDPRSRVAIQITQAYFNADQSEMIIVGGIGNPANATIVMDTPDISLKTPEGALGTLRDTEPPLPWNLGPGQNQSFTLHFDRLPSTSATLKILFASFELSGLR